MKDKKLMSSFLEIGDAWEIDRYAMQETKNRLDIFLVPVIKRQWFGTKYYSCRHCGHTMPLHNTTKTRRWRHLNFASVAVYLNVEVTAIFDCPQCKNNDDLLTWAEENSPMTLALEKQLAHMIPFVSSPLSICNTLGVSIDEVILVQKKLGLKTQYNEKSQAESNGFVLEEGLETNKNWLPKETHPAWHRLLTGSTNFKTTALPLQLLFRHSKLQYSKASTLEKKQKQVRTIRNYLLKYRKQSINEIRQIFG